MTPPSVIIPRSATELKKAKQLNGTASASNKSRSMPNVSGFVSGFAAQLHSSPPRRSDNAVDRNQRPMSNARRNVVPNALATANRHAAIELCAKRRAQHFSIDWLARALRHNELANLVVRQTKASRRLDDLALFVGAWHASAWAFLFNGSLLR